LYVCPLAIAFEQLESKQLTHGFISILLGVYLLSVYAFPNWIGIAQSALTSHHEGNESMPINSVAAFIRKNTTDEDAISVFGNYHTLYLLSDRFSASKWSYQTTPIEINPKVCAEYFSDLERTKPKIIVKAKEFDPWIEKQMDDFLSENSYDRIEEISVVSLFLRETP